MHQSRILLHRHSSYDKSIPAFQSIHHVICVTLKDGTAWIIDPAGSQHGQTKAFLPFAEYQRDYVAAILARHPYGERKLYLEKFSVERHPADFYNLSYSCKMGENLGHVVDELEEWELKHGSIKSVIEANSGDYARLKNKLVDHLASAAREFTKFCHGDPTSTAKPIDLNANPATLPEEDKQKWKRKMERHMAAMDPSQLEMVKSEQAQGNTVLFL